MKRQLFVESFFRNAQDLVTLKIAWRDDIIIFVVEFIKLRFLGLVGFLTTYNSRLTTYRETGGSSSGRTADSGSVN
jgi:hypothetical protein